MTQPRRYAVVQGKLLLDWDDLQIEIGGNQLRYHCRCAECRYLALAADDNIDNAAAGDETKSLRVDTEINALSPLGYGLQLHFSDGHNRGVFPWRYLREIAVG